MKRRFVVSVVAIMAALSCVGAASASAASEIGSSCGATGGADNYDLGQLSKNPTSPPPLTTAVSGVITAWKVNVVIPLGGKAYPSQLKVLRSVGGNSFTVVSQSAPATVVQGVNIFPTRLPVQAGDRLGLGGGPGFIQWYCETGDPLDVLAFSEESNVPSGGTLTFADTESGLQLAVSAVVEPDADNDGFGDETQDQCPQSAASQAACPAVSLNATVTATKKLANVLVTSTIAANVTVTGKVSLGKGRKATLKGGTKATSAGTFTKFRLSFPSKLIKRLKELTPKQSLTLKITASAPNVAVAPTKKVIKVKLKGQG